MRAELQDWFEREGLMRAAVSADERGEISETLCGPLVALGPGDDDFVPAPTPEETGYPQPLRTMSMDDYNTFMYRWFEAAAHADALRCANCGRLICDADDLPDPETWDAIFVEKELVAWMVVHFDCKRWLAKKLKGVNPYELTPGETPRLDLSAAPLPEGASDGARA
jgi:hypothetical protein